VTGRGPAVRFAAAAALAVLLTGCGEGEDSRQTDSPTDVAPAAAPGDFSPTRLPDEAVCDLASDVLPRLESEIGIPEVQQANPAILDDPDLTPDDFSMCSFDFNAYDGGSMSIAQLSNRAAENLLTADSPEPCAVPAGTECIERIPNMFVLRSERGSFMVQVYLYPPGYDSSSYDSYDKQVAAELLPMVAGD